MLFFSLLELKVALGEERRRQQTLEKRLADADEVHSQTSKCQPEKQSEISTCWCWKPNRWWYFYTWITSWQRVRIFLCQSSKSSAHWKRCKSWTLMSENQQQRQVWLPVSTSQPGPFTDRLSRTRTNHFFLIYKSDLQALLQAKQKEHARAQAEIKGESASFAFDQISSEQLNAHFRWAFSDGPDSSFPATELQMKLQSMGRQWHESKWHMFLR